MLEVPDKLETAEDCINFISSLLTEMETLITASMNVQALYEDLLVISKDSLEENAHLKRIIWGDGNED